MKSYEKLCNKLCDMVFRITFPNLLKLKQQGLHFSSPEIFSLGDNKTQSETN